jgi:hypothetical protein
MSVKTKVFIKSPFSFQEGVLGQFVHYKSCDKINFARFDFSLANSLESLDKDMIMNTRTSFFHDAIFITGNGTIISDESDLNSPIDHYETVKKGLIRVKCKDLKISNIKNCKRTWIKYDDTVMLKQLESCLKNESVSRFKTYGIITSLIRGNIESFESCCEGSILLNVNNKLVRFEQSTI